jgi:hypothetical protein
MEQKHYFVHWIDGMKINKNHFIGLEDAMIRQQYEIIKSQINPYNYGILPGTGSVSSLDFSCKADADNHVHVSLNRCKALTSGGILIDIDSSSPELNEFEIALENFDLNYADSRSNQFYILLKINPFARNPAGAADPSENPPRHPFAIPELGIFIIPVEQISKEGLGDYYQIIGKLSLKDNIPAFDSDYIPPCASVSSDVRLLSMENKLTGFLSKLEMDILAMIRKIHTKQQKSPLAASVLSLADKLSSFLGLQMVKQKLYLKYSPPVELFETVVQFARFLRNTLNTQPPENKEEMINYFSDWCNLKQGELEKLMTDITSLRYIHFEITTVMSQLMSFMETISALFETLSQLDYIGKRRDTQIYIKEEGKQKRSFLAED